MDQREIDVTGAETKRLRRFRLACIDDARCLAIIAMILIHFGEGIFIRVPVPDFVEFTVTLAGRFATPAFIVIFGATIGFVYLPKFIAGHAAEISQRFYQRLLPLFLCAAIVVTHKLIRLIHAGETSPLEYINKFYSILAIYVLLVAAMPIVLRVVHRRPYRMSIGLGLACWIIGDGLVRWVWFYAGELTVLEVFRFYLISGKFGFLQMLGTALLAMPIGYSIRDALNRDHRGSHMNRLALLGIGLAAAGCGLGILTGEFSLAGIVDGSLTVPPRYWYFLLFGGSAVLLISLLDWLHRAIPHFTRIAYPMTLSGQCALPIYTGHALVLPLLGLTDQVLNLEGIWRILLPFGAFGIFWLLVIYRRHRMFSPSRHQT